MAETGKGMAANDDRFYDDLAGDYDRLIRWQSRLRTERPWFEALWKRFGVRSVLDASCGTGHHMVLFTEQGLEVTGADASIEMVEAARRNLGEAGIGTDGRVVHSTWADLATKVPRQFDAVLCIGNSLPYVLDPDEFHASLRGIWSRVAPGGVAMVQFRNFEKAVRSGQRFLPLMATSQPVETLGIRMYDFHPHHIDFNVILVEKFGGEWRMRHRVTTLKPYTPDEVESVFRALGGRAEVYGNLGLEPFDRALSDDAVIVARHA
jgi:glycine/sarcosine N-methyltransferase